MEGSTKFLTSNFPELSKFPNEIDSYEKLYKFSLENNSQFWEVLAKTRLEWFNMFDQVNNNSKFSQLEDFKLKWFLNGKINVSGIINSYLFSFVHN